MVSPSQWNNSSRDQCLATPIITGNSRTSIPQAATVITTLLAMGGIKSPAGLIVCYHQHQRATYVPLPIGSVLPSTTVCTYVRLGWAQPLLRLHL
jgi:hypothetical protein